MRLTADAKKAVETIVAAGGRPLLVGGRVRDWLLGVPSKDFDIEVHGPVSVDQIETALRSVGRVDAVGKSFGVLKFGRDVDVSFPRRDSKTGAGHTGFAIEFDQDMTVDEALSRRDFTINSIAMDAVTMELIDPFYGQAAIKAEMLVATATEAFSDDPLRVLRAVQFAGRFGFTIAPVTAEMSRSVRDRFSELSIERVWGEWEKILTKGKSTVAVWEALVDTGWDIHFPEWENSPFTDKVIERIDKRGIRGERRAAMIIGSMFTGRQRELASFLRRIDAPQWLRRTSAKLAEAEPTTEKLDLDAKVRVIARWLGHKVAMQDWLRVQWFLPDSPMFVSALKQGILDHALPRLLRGEHLFADGFEAGPIFATILQQAEVTQDRQGWTTEEEAVAWLRAHWKAPT